MVVIQISYNCYVFCAWSSLNISSIGISDSGDFLYKCIVCGPVKYFVPCIYIYGDLLLSIKLAFADYRFESA